MADTLTLLGLLLNLAGAMLLVLHRFPSLEITADGRSMVPPQGEPAPEERARNLRRYWRHAPDHYSTSVRGGDRTGGRMLCNGGRHEA